MCGIVGIASFYNDLSEYQEKIKLSLKKLSNRGPDYSDYYYSDNVILGHTRLAIIDTSSNANQPFIDNSRQFVIVLNGEIYNFIELRKYLEKKGYSFKSNSDTEVLLYLYKEKGTECLNYINGDFAFAIHDKVNDQLFIARDRLGVKPLYYGFINNTLYFSSELKGILPLLNFNPEMSDEAFLFYLQLNYIPAPLTIYKQFYKLLPGNYLLLNKNGLKSIIYYELPTEQNQIIDENEARIKLRDLLEESVKKRLVSDVPIGAFLSGGIDSSIITAIANKYKSNLETFTICFQNNKFYDESKYAEKVADFLKTKHHTICISESDLLSVVVDILNNIDEPYADSSSIAAAALARYTRNHITVALSGDGGDELFAGYNKHYAHLLSFKYQKYKVALNLLSSLLKILPQSRNNYLFNKFRQINRFIKGINLPSDERYWFWASLQSKLDIEKLLIKKYASPKYTLKTKAENINDVLINDLLLVLPNDMLYKADFTSMMYALEVRVPMLDHEVVNFVVSLPSNYKIMNKKRKIILNKAFQDYLPEFVFNRPKHGFEVPLDYWLNDSLSSYVEELTREDFLKRQNLFNIEQIKNLKLMLKSTNKSDSAMIMWNLLVFQHWWKKNYL